MPMLQLLLIPWLLRISLIYMPVPSGLGIYIRQIHRGHGIIININMHFKIGHGREERHRKESYVVFIPKKYSHFALALWEKIIRK